MLTKIPRITKLALLSCGLIFLGLALAFYGELFLGILGTLFSMGVVCGELMLPLWALERCHITPQKFHLYAFHLETIFDAVIHPKAVPLKPEWPKIGRELLFTVMLCGALFVPYCLGFYAFFQWWAASQDETAVFFFNLPPSLFKEIVTQLLVVALPEELFYRGFLQGALLYAWPNQRFFLGLPVGFSLIATNVIFACGHIISGFSPMRILTFFPGMIFSWLVYKRHNVLSAIIFHAACNILGQILYRSWFLH